MRRGVWRGISRRPSAAARPCAAPLSPHARSPAPVRGASSVTHRQGKVCGTLIFGIPWPFLRRFLDVGTGRIPGRNGPPAMAGGPSPQCAFCRGPRLRAGGIGAVGTHRIPVLSVVNRPQSLRVRTGTPEGAKCANRRSGIASAAMADDLARRKFLLGLGAASGLASRAASRGRTSPVTAAIPCTRSIRCTRARSASPATGPTRAGPRAPTCCPRSSTSSSTCRRTTPTTPTSACSAAATASPVGDGVPTNSNVDAEGRRVPVYHAPDTCQHGRGVSQNWDVDAPSDRRRPHGRLPLRRQRQRDALLGRHRPALLLVARRAPSRSATAGSRRCPAQTYPNRRYLQAATCQDLIATDISKVLAMPAPRRRHDLGPAQRARHLVGRLRVRPARHPAVPETLRGEPRQGQARSRSSSPTAATGHAAVGVDRRAPGVATYTEENPADIQLGEAYSSSIINAVMHGPAWPKTVLFFMYDEHGGYYDHVPPPAAIPPDDIAPAVAAAPGRAGGVRPVRPAGPGVRDLAVRQARLRVARRARPHVGAAVHRDEVQPRRADLPRRQRRRTCSTASTSGGPRSSSRRRSPRPGLPATGSLCSPEIPPPPTSAAAAARGAGVTTSSNLPLSDSMQQRMALLTHAP